MTDLNKDHNGLWSSMGLPMPCNEIGAVIISPKGCHTPFTARLCFDCTINMAEYETCILGLKAVIDLRIKHLNVFGDSALVIIQVKGDWDTDTIILSLKRSLCYL